MLTLEQQQRSLLAIVRGASKTHSDQWLESVETSPGLKMIHTIVLWWQRFQIEWQCRYTSRLMKRLGCFDSYVAAHFREHPTPPSIEELTAQFLSSLQRHEDPLLRAVASLELACIKSNITPERSTTIFWDRDPNQVMDALDPPSCPSPSPRCATSSAWAPTFPKESAANARSCAPDPFAKARQLHELKMRLGSR